MNKFYCQNGRRTNKMKNLLIVIALFVGIIACENDKEQSEPDLGGAKAGEEMAGSTAGEEGGSTAGEDGGAPAGSTAGSQAGEEQVQAPEAGNEEEGGDAQVAGEELPAGSQGGEMDIPSPDMGMPSGGEEIVIDCDECPDDEACDC